MPGRRGRCSEIREPRCLVIRELVFVFCESQSKLLHVEIDCEVSTSTSLPAVATALRAHQAIEATSANVAHKQHLHARGSGSCDLSCVVKPSAASGWSRCIRTKLGNAIEAAFDATGAVSMLCNAFALLRISCSSQGPCQ